MAKREINLDGTEISVIKALGLGGGEIDGETLVSRAGDLDASELIDALKGLIGQGYIDADKDSFYSLRDMEKINFHVNTGYAKDLKEAMNPKDEKPKSRRVRRE